MSRHGHEHDKVHTNVYMYVGVQFGTEQEHVLKYIEIRRYAVADGVAVLAFQVSKRCQFTGSLMHTIMKMK